MNIHNPTTPTGVDTCHRCGWPFPNAHPSSEHRRAHKEICGTIQGYTKLTIIDSDQEEEEEEKTPNAKTTPGPKIEKIMKEGGSGGGTLERSNRSEEDLFSDAKTEFSDSGISPGVEERFVGSEKTMDGEILRSFKDTENADPKLLDSPIAVKKDDDVLEVFETPDSHSKDADKAEENSIITEAKIKLPESDVKASDPLVEDRDGSHNDKFIGLMEPSDPAHKDTFDVSDKKEQGEDVYVLSIPGDIPLVDHSESLILGFKDHESQPSENGEPSAKSTVTEEVKVLEGQPLETSQTIPESIDSLNEAQVSTDSKEIVQEKVEPDHEHVREAVKEAEIDVSVLIGDLASETVEERERGIEAEQKIVESGGADSEDRGSDVISQRSEKVIPEETEQAPNTSGAVSEALVEGNGKLLTSQDCGVDASVGSSSRNSLEGNWGSVSVLSTASIDAENTHSVDKSGIAADKNKSSLGKADVVKALPLVEPEEKIVDQKASGIKPVAVQNSEQPPGVTNIGNESEGRKRNKEAIAKVTNWSTGKHITTTTPLKNQVGEAKSPNPNQLSTTIQKDEVVEKNNEPGKSNLTSETSPPKYVGESEKDRKKAKGRGSWVPFACCSSVNVN